MIRTQKVTVTSSGSNGSATGNGLTPYPVSGRVRAIHLDYTSQPNTCDVTVATNGTPVLTILTVTNANTDAWFFPRLLMDDTAGTDLTAIYDAAPVDDHLKISIAQGDDGRTVVATILYEC